MQYAVIQGSHIMSGGEYQALMAHGEDIVDHRPCDDEMALLLVYGSFKPQVGETPLAAMNQTREVLDTYYGTIQGDQCLLSTLLDIVFYEPLYRGLAVDIPFAALMRTALDINFHNTRSIPCFIRYRDMSPATNILNRPGLLCVYRSEGGVKRQALVSESAWREAIAPKRPLQCARYCV